MRVAIVGAGIVGAATARALARRGAEVELIDAGDVSGGTTGLGEGNVLCADKYAGPELELAALGREMFDDIERRYGELALNTDFVHESVIGTRFTGRLVGETEVGGRAAVIPEITGRAWITGMGQSLLDPSDPFPAGFTL